MAEIRRLPDAELAVMQALWALNGPGTRAQIGSGLGEGHSMAPTTLLTLLSRLAERGFVAVDRSERSALYTPLVSREEYLAAQSRSFIDKLCGGKVSVLAAALCDSGLSREEIAELRGLLERDEL
ncbi:MAG TPA: BlaI/MecI/CopY family transcriptional regulator [Candidatus Scatomorpha pullistercoris]|uniref:BlaI/MecI/CopY family transcriptional regulator n=1 Tax=Candidatus Scatomorpha pullistercoris TaxID=2840929 RepID=A0A9D1G4R0_9FIRM|nr:BlaI/MecI/CopY family transcriptional regulator [Candidatus Scatomorpha pullistercoris]